MARTAGTARPPDRGRGLGWLGWALALILALVIAIFVGAVVLGAARILVGDEVNENVPVGREDSAIRDDIQAALRRDTRIPVDIAVVVTVENGLVTLTGAVETFAQRQAAADVVRHTAGAVLVDNQLQVRPAGDISDQELQQRIVTGLGLNDTIDESKITVAVEGGVATFRGTVQSLAAKRAAQDVAASLAGIRDIRNLLMVEPAVSLPDDEITENVRANLFAHPVLREQSIAVRTEDGTVILTGAVRDLTSLELAEEIVVFTSGVRGLDNQLTVQR